MKYPLKSIMAIQTHMVTLKSIILKDALTTLYHLWYIANGFLKLCGL